MEASVKERLTGALIFVAAVVIFVPEILSGPAHRVPAAADPVQPAEGSPPLLTYSMSLKDSADPQASVQAVPAAQMPVAATSAAQPLPAPQPEAATPTAAAPAPTTAAAAAAAPAKSAWWVQLDTFSVRENAERLGRQLRAAGFTIEVSKINVHGKELYRVRAGPVSDRTEALALQSRLKANGNKSLLVAP